MAIPNTPSLLEINSRQLTQSADSLESALAQFSKLAASIEHQPSVTVPALSNSGKGFDEWLASDLNYGALLSGDETPLISSPYSVPEESPLLEYEIMNSGTVPSLFESPPSAQHHSYGSRVLSTVQGHELHPIEQVASFGLTTQKLQQAAAALNIPWSHELQKAVLAQTVKHPIGTTTQDGLRSQQLTSNAANVKSTIKRSRSPEEEETEEILAKRAKNTDAARRSRLKKLAKLETLEVKVAELEATNHRLNTRVAVLETEKNGFLIKEAEQNARIAQLEAKVMEAHLTLKTRTS
ncbi:hypothetical protein EDD21DRAFT_389683 [Dissophora ornata]|nr:hypothetical protein BGZ58_004411 [Dissophora ornata]KAI8595982.1 hypothetical protein EDD21DRAFT_389683 [Dissophora ornata]